MSISKLKIGTRGSKLALIQTDLVLQALKKKHPNLKVSVKTIVTEGDKNHSPIPLDTIGKTWFTKELDDALLNGEIDLAIHSLKDIPPEIPVSLRTMPVLARDDPRDVLVATKSVSSLHNLPKGAVIGTDSLRRKAQLLYHRPDLMVKSIRGNVDTRLQKLEHGDYDAIMVAAAGLNRLGLSNRITQFFEPEEIVPAPGQATLAAEIRQADNDISKLLASIQDETTTREYQAEQAFTDVIGGGCKLPVGCYTKIGKISATIYGMVGSLDAQRAVIKSVSGSNSSVIEDAKNLAQELLKESVRLGW